MRRRHEARHHLRCRLPLALQRLGRTYRIRSIGGTSAGAIAAAIGAAAEHGRPDGGMDKLGAIPARLADGRLVKLLQPQPTTRSLMRLMLTATAHGQSPLRKISSVLGAIVSSHAVAAVFGGIPVAAKSHVRTFFANGLGARHAGSISGQHQGWHISGMAPPR